MHDLSTLLLFLAAATAIAVSPGPAMLYVASRTLAGGRGEGMASTLGTGIGGFVHVLAGAVGVSALIAASAAAFTALKLVGGVYLIWLAVRMWRGAALVVPTGAAATGARAALREGIVVEATNPKTAAFFLAFLPQFVDPAGHVAVQFVVLGAVSVALNTGVDALVVLGAARIRRAVLAAPAAMRRVQQGCAAVLGGLGLALLLARRPA
jgi:threonine/homoserine/homoserine lactone efflux protein